MQLATLSVLAATFSVVAFVLSLSLNLKRVLSNWGDGVQMTVYLNDDLEEDGIKKLKAELGRFKDVTSINFVNREVATENFKKQMASYAPDLLADADFSNPFPASFKLSLKTGVADDADVARLENLAAAVGSLEGVEDVSYGQSWVKNYSSFVSTLYASSGVMAVILLAGSLFVVANSIRASISARREEIQILELVGATASMIRRPYVVEGLIMGALATFVAIGLNLGLHFWQKSVMAGSLVLSRLVPMFTFLDALTILSFLAVGAGVGAFGAWVTVRKINDGWSASAQGAES
jgi:cell division transport system permease protein